MSRTLSSPINTEKAKLGQRTFWLVDIHLKADGIYSAQDFYFSTQAVEANGHNYEPLLKSKPTPRMVLGSATDSGEVKIDNTDFSFGQIILPKDRFINGSEVKIYFGWKIDGTVETDTVFIGEITNANLSVANNAVSLNLVGDLYNPNLVLGGFPLSQRCVHPFNVNGTLSPEESLCGWQSGQGGNPDLCDKTEDGQDGCAAHFNLHRIGAIPFFANVVIEIVQTSVESSGFNQTGRRDSNPELEPFYPNYL